MNIIRALWSTIPDWNSIPPTVYCIQYTIYRNKSKQWKQQETRHFRKTKRGKSAPGTSANYRDM